MRIDPVRAALDQAAQDWYDIDPRTAGRSNPLPRFQLFTDREVVAAAGAVVAVFLTGAVIGVRLRRRA